MKNVIRPLILGTLVALPLGAANAVEFAADIELDTDINDADTTTYTQGGRIRLQASGKKEMNGYFVSGHLEGLFKEDGTTGTDNAYIMFGNDSWDVQAGRFEGVNLFPVGKDTVLSHVTGTNGVVYQANLGRGRIGDNAGGIALHFKPAGALSFEIDTVWGDNVTGGSDEETFSVIRPSLTFTGDGFSVTAGLESRSADNAAGTAVADDTGVAVTANFDAGGANINVNFATLTDDVNNRDTNTIGANAVIGDFGVGLVSSSSQTDGAADADITSLYAAYTQDLLGIDGASITYAISNSTLDESGTTDDSLSVIRVRLNYAF